MLYILAAVIGYICHMIYTAMKPQTIDSQIFGYLKMGRRIIICIENDATIMQMIDNKIRVSKAIVDFNDEVPYELDSNNVVDINSVQSTDDPETGNRH